MGGIEKHVRDDEPSTAGRLGAYARATVHMLAWAALVGGVAGLPWDVPNRSFELLRNVASGPDEQGARYVQDCLDQVFLSLTPGSTVALMADDPYWYQRAVEVGYPRLRFSATAPDVDITMSATPPDAAAVGATGTVWTCGPEYIVAVPRG